MKMPDYRSCVWFAQVEHQLSEVKWMIVKGRWLLCAENLYDFSAVDSFSDADCIKKLNVCTIGYDTESAMMGRPSRMQSWNDENRLSWRIRLPAIRTYSRFRWRTYWSRKRILQGSFRFGTNGHPDGIYGEGISVIKGESNAIHENISG